MIKSTLYIVATPIGNLSDISPRAIEILRSSDLILCEDTRHTKKLLCHFQIQTPCESLHVHNEKQKMIEIVEKLYRDVGTKIALVSDAGTPAICDPGAYLVALAHEKSIDVLCLPGPSSLTSALSASGFIQPRVIFSGFLSKHNKERRSEFQMWLLAAPCIAVFFESPRRVLSALVDLAGYLEEECASMNDIQVNLSKEISKKFEQHKVLLLPDAIDHLRSTSEILGEYVVCLNIKKNKKQDISFDDVVQKCLEIHASSKSPLKIITKDACAKYGYPKKELYKKLTEILESDS